MYFLRIAFFILLGAWQICYASVPMGPRYYLSGASTTPNYPTKQAACDSWSPSVSDIKRVVEGNVCVLRRSSDGSEYYRFSISSLSACPDNSTASGSTCTCKSDFNEENGQCVAQMSSEKACGIALYNSGSVTRVSVTLDGNVDDGVYCQPQGDDVKPGLACAMTFEKDIGWKTDDGKWHSRGVLQPRMIGGNFQPCVPGIDPSNNPPDPAKPPEIPKKQDSACPNGYPGDVGGQTKCIPSFGYNGVDFAPKTKSSETATSKTNTTTKTECASGKCTTTETVKVTDKATGQSTTTENVTTEVDRDWCNKAENKDKCAANGKPPYSGQGTGSSSNGTGNGDGDGDDKGGRCGAKGQPPCKIDETGTPTGEGKFDALLDKQAQDHQSRMDTLGGIKSTADKDTSMGFSGFAWLTHKSCSPWNLGDLKILTETFKIELNICAIEPYVIPVMNFLWLLATVFMTFSRVASVMGAKVD
ncbi:hypothetical protein [Comamonas sp. 26]|uniref:hypothetical protein n=1 Tax=Comamonas sp. 26 TaxID=2035201 RepID=UPI0011982085|nr:hypothetical protein [Comamonas sp. 26]